MSTTEVIIHPEVIEFKGPDNSGTKQFLSIWSDGTEGFLFSNKTSYQATGGFSSADPTTNGVISLNKVKLGATTATASTMDGLILDNTSMSNVESVVFKPGGTNSLDLQNGAMSNVASLQISSGILFNGNDISNVTNVTFTDSNGAVNLKSGSVYTTDSSSAGLTLSGTSLVHTSGAANDMTLQGITVNDKNVSLNSSGALYTTDSSSAGLTVSGTSIVHTSGASNDMTLQGVTVNNKTVSLNSSGILYTTDSSTAGLTLSGTSLVHTSGAANDMTLQGITVNDSNVSLNSSGSLYTTDSSSAGLTLSGTSLVHTSGAANDMTLQGVTVNNKTVSLNSSGTLYTTDASTAGLTLSGTTLVHTSGASNDMTLQGVTVGGTAGQTVTLGSNGTLYSKASNSTDGLMMQGATLRTAAGADNDMTLQGVTVNDTTVSLNSSGTLYTTDSSTAGLTLSGTTLIHTSGASNDMTLQGVTVGGTAGQTVTLGSAGTLYSKASNSTDGLMMQGATLRTAAGADNDMTLQSITVNDSNISLNTNGHFYTTDSSSAGLTLTGTTLVHTSGVSNDMTLQGVTVGGSSGQTVTLGSAGTLYSKASTSTDGLMMQGATLRTAAGADNDMTLQSITVNDSNISLNTNGHFYTTDSSSAGLTLTGTTLVHTSGAANNMTLQGVTVNDTTVSLNSSGTLYTTDSTSAGLTVSGTSIVHTSGAANDMTLQGVTVNNKTVSLNSSGTLYTTDSSSAGLTLSGTSLVHTSGAANDMTLQGVTVNDSNISLNTNGHIYTTDSSSAGLTLSGTTLVHTSGASNDMTLQGVTVGGTSGQTVTLGSNGTLYSKASDSTDGLMLQGSTLRVAAGASNDMTLQGVTVNDKTVSLNSSGTLYTTDSSSAGLTLSGTSLVHTSGAANDMTLQGVTVNDKTVSLNSSGTLYTTDSSSAGLTLSGTSLVHTSGASNNMTLQGVTIGGTSGQTVTLGSNGVLNTATSGSSAGLTLSAANIRNSNGTSTSMTVQNVSFNDKTVSLDNITKNSGSSVDIEGSVFTGTNGSFDGSKIVTQNIEIENIMAPSSLDHIEFDGSRLSNVGLPVNLNDVVTLQYLRNEQDNALQGLKPKEAVAVASVRSDLLTSGSIQYDWDSSATNVFTDPSGNTDTTNVLPDGVLMIADTSGNVSFDGYEVSVGDRILIKDFQTGDVDRDGIAVKGLNGIWVVKDKNGHGSGDTMTPASGGSTFTGACIALRRSDDMNANVEVMNGAYVYSTNGSTQKDTGYVVLNPDPITLEAGLTKTDVDENDATLIDDVLTWGVFNNVSSGLTMGKVSDGSTTKSTATNIHDRWQGEDRVSGSQKMTSGALMMRAFGDNDATIAIDATLLSFKQSFATGGRYNDSNNTSLNHHNIDFMNTTFYTDDGSDYSGNNTSIHSSSETTSQHDVSADYVLSLKGHIVLEESGTNRAGTINKVEFHPNGDLYTNGNIEASSLTAFSDKRLKKNVKDLENPIDLVNKFRGVTFNWNSDETCEQPEYGFIAQEVQENFPTLVAQSKGSGLLSVDYMKVCSILCGAVQELSKEVQELKQKLST